MTLIQFILGANALTESAYRRGSFTTPEHLQMYQRDMDYWSAVFSDTRRPVLTERAS